MPALVSHAVQCQPFNGSVSISLAVLQVMFMLGPEKKGDGHESGTHKVDTGKRCWGRQQRLASSMYWRRYGEYDKVIFPNLAIHIANLNARLLEPLSPQSLAQNCPLATGCAAFLRPAP